MMMTQRRKERGSALLLSIVVVIMVLGIGGAFLAESIFRGKGQYASIEAEEALLMCDAGMEKARRALYVHRSTNTWTWNEILAYCNSAPESSKLIKDDYLSLKSGSTYTTYRSKLGDGNDSKEAGLNTIDSALPASKTSPTKTDPANGVFFACNSPYLKGSLHVKVKDNDDGDGKPLEDKDNKVLVIVTATLPDGTQRQIEGLIEYAVQTMKVNGIAAVVANDTVDVNGTITIDGRDWDINGSSVVGTGVFGVVGVKGIGTGGSASTGGNGNAPPAKGVATNSQSANHSFPDGYPAGPDESLGLKSGTLKGMAESAGTYFKTEAAYEAYISANGGKMPSGKILYCDFDPGSSFNLGDDKNMNVDPSILVVHTDTMSASMKNIHGGFKGVLLADSIVHVNANTNILGMIQTFSPTSSKDGNVFGNGGANIKFSSAALAKLPASQPDSAKLLSWRKLLQ